ncbi:AMP-binding enzyme family protein (macronuclear) [Tetrahymena thermophila SB210]|uniref:AMP-binding enzyme family protein n=1 Tax=Tetrahymena thermophila (strain SB210) TaxID=312017 RepID=Q23JU1_TETTS|nr:AMP-binding enzyme family protein [Tetrahymena thermophila SB210]EAR96769.2 AMP-binding enzyme family protein [Tetrahymena thermophila SB210]|eukprot:XP_001017014.2 AMP-binding enzyme family protein [Tetrahymena thermophila SB210]
MKKGTLFGFILSIFVILTTLCYFIYIIQQYATNQIEPNFRSQSFINDGEIDIPLNSDLVAFKFDYGDNTDLYKANSKNKTYLVYYAFFYYQKLDKYDNIRLPVFECTNPKLLGFYCLDLSVITNTTLVLNTQENILSQIQLYTYGCLDVDDLKKTVPNNCATQQEIDHMVNGINAAFKLKLLTSQYNTQTQQNENNYRNVLIYTVANQQIVTQIKAQKQVTSVKQGLIVQTQSQYSSPISYTQSDQPIDRTYAANYIGIASYNCLVMYMDEIVQQIQIQYPSLPQVFSFINSIFTFLMLLGILGRAVSQFSIKKDFFMLFLKNQYQDTYLQIMKENQLQNTEKQKGEDKYAEKNEQINTYYLQQQKQTQTLGTQAMDGKGEEDEEAKRLDNNKPARKITVPAFSSKQKQSLDLEAVSPFNSNKIDKNNEQPEGLEAIAAQLNELSNKIQHDCSNNENQNDKNNFSNVLCKQNSQISKFYQVQDSVIQECQQGQGELLNSQFTEENYQFSPYKSSLLQSQFKKQSSLVSPSNYQSKLQEQIKKSVSVNTQIVKSIEEKMKNMKNIQNKNLSDKLVDFIFKMRVFKKKKELVGGLKQSQLQQIESQINKELDILNFVKDIMFLKKAIMLVFDPDQLAALQLIGCSQHFLDQQLVDFESDPNQFENDITLSFYEKQFVVSQSEKLQQHYMKRFLDKCTNKSNFNELDERILASLKN